MSSIKLAYATAVSLTKTNANLANSATAGWQSQSIDNTTNLYLDYLVQLQLAAVNTAPSSNQAIYMFAMGLLDTGGSAYGSNGSATPTGSEGTMTFPNVSTAQVVCPLIGVVPYPTQNTAINSSLFSVAKAFGGIVPPKFVIGMVNFSGMTLNVTAIETIGVYETIA